MGIFSGLFRSRDKPQNRTSGSAYSFFFGGSSAGKRVNERSAMQMTAVYSCVRILAEAVAGLPLHLYRYKEDGGKEKAIDHPLYLLLHDEMCIRDRFQGLQLRYRWTRWQLAILPDCWMLRAVSLKRHLVWMLFQSKFWKTGHRSPGSQNFRILMRSRLTPISFPHSAG